MKQHRFRAAITLDPVAGGGPLQDYPGGTHVLTVLAGGHAGPGDQGCFPAVLSRDEELPRRPVGHVVVTVALADGEAETFFPPGQPFTIWADCLVGDAIWPGARLAMGMIFCPLYLPPALGDGYRRKTAAGAARGHSPAATPRPAAADHGQRVAV